MEFTLETLRSFGRDAEGKSLVCRPTTVEDVREAFNYARAKPCRATIRGGGHSFDSQALHAGDTGQHLIISTECFNNKLVKFHRNGTVRLGAGVPWSLFLEKSIEHARKIGSILIPGSMQTGRAATVGGTLAGDCLSRFSGTEGKESQWIESFTLLTTDGVLRRVTKAAADSELFNAVVGGHGYIGFVTEATYRLTPIDSRSCAHTRVTTHQSVRAMLDQQQRRIRQARRDPTPRAISSAGFGDPLRFKGAVFDSHYAPPSGGKASRFPLYDDIDGDGRFAAELVAREPLGNLAIHEYLFTVCTLGAGKPYENKELEDFIFFMDGNTVAKERFEDPDNKKWFPIVQQTYVIPTIDAAVKFAESCLKKTALARIPLTEFDVLFVQKDDCLMSANYEMAGFAVTLGFEPRILRGNWPDGFPPDNLVKLLQRLSSDALDAGGRIHLVKNVYVKPEHFRKMFPKIEEFENIKRKYDPDLLLQNDFSDCLFEFAPPTPKRRARPRR